MRHTAAALLGAVMSGCASAPGAAPPGLASPAAESRTAAYDWHALVLVPFGTLFKDMPIALSEVLTFHDSAESRRANEDDCYSTQGVAPPNLLGRRPDDYLLCFDHDRLSKIQASVSVPAADAASLFAAACAQWQRGASGAASAAAESCAGGDGNTEFSARLCAGEPPSMDSVALTLRRRP